MKRIASGVGRLLIGLAATVFLLGALLFLVGLHLTMLPLRVQSHARLRLALEIAERATQLVMMGRGAAGEDGGSEPREGPRSPLASTQDRGPSAPQED